MNATLREGRACALTVALKEDPEGLWDEKFRPKLIQTLLSQLTAPSAVINQIAIRSCGYLLQFLLMNGEPIPNNLLVPFVRVSKPSQVFGSSPRTSRSSYSSLGKPLPSSVPSSVELIHQSWLLLDLLYQWMATAQFRLWHR